MTAAEGESVHWNVVTYSSQKIPYSLETEVMQVPLKESPERAARQVKGPKGEEQMRIRVLGGRCRPWDLEHETGLAEFTSSYILYWECTAGTRE